MPEPCMDEDAILVAAHSHSLVNRSELDRSEICGCFYCKAIYPPSEITEWIHDRTITRGDGETALCPRCAIDSVLGSASGYPIDATFLKQMHMRWFE